jgi:hypothetical protein
VGLNCNIFFLKIKEKNKKRNNRFEGSQNINIKSQPPLLFVREADSQPLERGERISSNFHFFSLKL